jgi:hypothetical protein
VGCEDLENYSKSGWLLTAQNLETAVKVCELMARKHQTTLKLIKKQPHINHELAFWERGNSERSLCHSPMDEKQKERVTTCKLCSTQCHGWATWEESQLVKTSSRPVKPTQCTVTEDILGVSTWSWHMSEHEIQTKIITETPKFFLAKVENHNNVDRFLMNRVWSTKHLCLKDKEYTVNSMYSCYESYCRRFWKWNYNSEKKVVSSFCNTMPLLILHNNKVLPSI